MKITCRQELEATRGEDFITCLICHQDFRLLTWTHVMRVHSLSHTEYREKFGIPANFSLACNSYRRDAAKRAEGVLTVLSGLALGLKALGPGGRKPSMDWVRKEAARRRKDCNKARTAEWYRENGRRSAVLGTRAADGRFA